MSSTLSNAELWLEIRQKRNSRLLETDWTQINDSALSDSKKEEYKIYRQSLRDLIQEIKKHDNYTNENETNPRDDCGDWQFPNKPT
tara:strand:- start:78 stop:335 length:258 start_codon:yes stop_codon:yes gene_type:complete